jgi:uncharacterized membrane protein SpoIIM required for sporulation
MDYSRFLQLREPFWRRFEERLAAARRDPRRLTYEDLEELALTYRQVLHDHALATARFGSTGAARRLEWLAIQGTRWIYGPAGGRRGGFLRFWTRSFPMAFRENLANLSASVALFAVAALFGLFLASIQTGMASALLSPQAVRGLEERHLWTEKVLHAAPPALTSSAIATNNISVSLVGWAGGALAGLGSLYIILFNGFLLGALFGVTLHYGLAGELAEFVSAHGPLEITLMLVTAAAGLGLARGLIEADDRPRGEAVAAAARQALSVLGGCVPWFILLALVETFLSPSPDFPVAAKVATGLSLEAIFLVAAWNPFLRKEES